MTSSRGGSSASAQRAKKLALSTPLAPCRLRQRHADARLPDYSLSGQLSPESALSATLTDYYLPSQPSASSQAPTTTTATVSTGPLSFGRKSVCGNREHLASPASPGISPRELPDWLPELRATTPRVPETLDARATTPRLQPLEIQRSTTPRLQCPWQLHAPSARGAIHTAASIAMSKAASPPPDNTSGHMSAAGWVAEASKASSMGAETSTDVELLCRDLQNRCQKLELELEAKRKEVRLVSDQSTTVEQQIAAIEWRIALARAARVKAFETVQGLTRMSANEVKAMKNRPPSIVRRAIEAIFIVLSCRRWLPGAAETIQRLDVTKEWTSIQRMLSNDGFVQSVLHFDVAGLDATPHVAKYVAAKYFPGLLQEATAPLQAPTEAPKSLPPVTARRAPGTPAMTALAAEKESSAAWPSSARAGAAASLAPLEGLLPGMAAAVLTTPAATAAQVAQPPGSTPRRSSENTERRRRNSFSRKSSTEVETLDLDAVEYASRACGAMVRWVWEVLREFFALRDLRLQHQALRSQLEELGAVSREEAIMQLQAEIQKLQEEYESWRTKLGELRACEAEAERAKASLLLLSRLEERSKPVPASGRSGRAAKLQPVIAPSAPNLEDWPSARGGPVLKAVKKELAKPVEVKRKPKRDSSENAAWPPKNRKYLHIMSSSSLAIKTVVEEAADRGSADD